jgi:hypothetical protein
LDGSARLGFASFGLATTEQPRVASATVGLNIRTIAVATTRQPVTIDSAFTLQTRTEAIGTTVQPPAVEEEIETDNDPTDIIMIAALWMEATDL